MFLLDEIYDIIHQCLALQIGYNSCRYKKLYYTLKLFYVGKTNLFNAQSKVLIFTKKTFIKRNRVMSLLFFFTLMCNKNVEKT